MSNKALKYQLKNIVSNMKEDVLKNVLIYLEIVFQTKIDKLIKEKSYKW